MFLSVAASRCHCATISLFCMPHVSSCLCTTVFSSVGPPSLVDTVNSLPCLCFTATLFHYVYGSFCLRCTVFMDHFVSIALCLWIILSPLHCVYGSFCLRSTMLMDNFVSVALCPWIILSPLHYVYGSFCLRCTMFMDHFVSVPLCLWIIFVSVAPRFFPVCIMYVGYTMSLLHTVYALHVYAILSCCQCHSIYFVLLSVPFYLFCLAVSAILSILSCCQCHSTYSVLLSVLFYLFHRRYGSPVFPTVSLSHDCL